IEFGFCAKKYSDAPSLVYETSEPLSVMSRRPLSSAFVTAFTSTPRDDARSVADMRTMPVDFTPTIAAATGNLAFDWDPASANAFVANERGRRCSSAFAFSRSNPSKRLNGPYDFLRPDDVTSSTTYIAPGSALLRSKSEYLPPLALRLAGISVSFTLVPSRR